jgi:hypothetical protein
LVARDEYLLFPMDSEVATSIDRSFQALVSTEMLLMSAFEKTAKEFEATEVIKPYRFSLSREQMESPYALSEVLKGQLHHDLIDFNSKTENFFVPEILKQDLGFASGL